jgi:hypothetical protein
MIDESVMKPVCKKCLKEIDEESVGQFVEIDCDLRLCWNCLEREAYGIDEVV